MPTWDRMLRLSEVTASYGAAPVLQGVSLHVERGETVALLGPNGAGKSTLMAAITGTIARRGGQIELEGRNLVGDKSHAIVARGVALVPEGRLVFAPFTVEDNLRLGAIRLRDPATIKLMGYPQTVRGHVDSIAQAINVTNAQPNQEGVASVNPIFTWVRLAQRIPVRIHIDEVPEGVVLAAGMTATVQIDPQPRYP